MKEVDVVRERVNLLERMCARLQKENVLLKKTIKEALAFMDFEIPGEVSLETEPEHVERWTAKSQRFAGLRGLLLKTAVDLIKKAGKPLHQDQILHGFAAKHPDVYRKIKSPGSTLSRRLRELRKDNWLTSPKKAYFWLGSKVVKSK